jgi:hypothetical protein
MANVISSTPAASLRPVLPAYNFADAFSTAIPGENLTARAAAERAFRHEPRWLKTLLGLRNGLANIAGLKSTSDVVASNASILGGFPIVSEAPERVVLGFDDVHLDFRIVVGAVVSAPGNTTVTVSTLVQTHNLMGRVYLLAILPFHKLIARTLIKKIENTAP